MKVYKIEKQEFCGVVRHEYSELNIDLISVNNFYILIGICNFESGMCAFRHANSNLHWTFGSGQTPSEGTGPGFDHTTLSQKGKEHESIVL